MSERREKAFTKAVEWIDDLEDLAHEESKPNVAGLFNSIELLMLAIEEAETDSVHNKGIWKKKKLEIVKSLVKELDTRMFYVGKYGK